MHVTTWHIQTDNADDALKQLGERAGTEAENARLVVFFANAALDAARLAEGMAERFGRARTLGSCGCIEFSADGFGVPGVSVLALGPEAAGGVEAELIEKISFGVDLHPVFRGMSERFRDRSMPLDHGSFVGLTLVDGFTGMDDRFIERIGDSSDVLFVGGTASGPLEPPTPTWVALDGKVATDAGVVAVFRPECRFRTAKLQSFKVDDTPPLVVTRVSGDNPRLVLELNGEPAAETYLRAHGLAPEAAEELLSAPPLGIVADGDLFVRCIKEIRPGRGLKFVGRIPEGQRLRTLVPTDVLAGMKAQLAAFEAELGKTAGVMEFLCYNRYLGMRREGIADEYLRLYGRTPLAGFVTFGEAYLGYMNSTSTLLAFGR